MKRVICLLLGLCLVPATIRAQDKKGGLTDPVEILKKVDVTCKAVKSVKYDLVFERTAWSRSPAVKLKGSVIMVGPLINGQPTKYFVDVETTQGDSAEVQRITSGCDGEVFYVVDHQNKKAYEDIDAAVIGSFGRYLRPTPMIEFLHETPYSDEINGKSRELKGFKEINGVDCYEIHVVYTAENAPPTIWFFGKEDFLPRCRVDEVMVEQGPEKFTQKRILANVVADPKLPAGIFKLKLPEGYTKTDDFAP